MIDEGTDSSIVPISSGLVQNDMLGGRIFIVITSASAGEWSPWRYRNVSLGVIEEVVDNRVMDRVVDGVRTSISSGGGLKDPIAASFIFPSMVVQMIGVGEETGRLGDLLNKSTVYLDREIDATIKSLITRIEPTMTVILAGVVAMIALSIYMPLFSVFEALK